MILLILRRRFAAEVWDDTTEALGGAEEAHRRWPEGRSEQGASRVRAGCEQGKGRPSIGERPGGALRVIGAAAPVETWRAMLRRRPFLRREPPLSGTRIRIRKPATQPIDTPQTALRA